MILSLGVLILFGVIVMAQQQSNNSGQACPASSPPSNAASNEQAARFDCLPDDITLKDVVTYGFEADKNVTVHDKLIEMKAKCKNGKLVDSHHREVRFFRLECWGNPPADYKERQQQQQERLKELEKKYTVIVMGCNPRMQ
jgi:hypothetical protein